MKFVFLWQDAADNNVARPSEKHLPDEREALLEAFAECCNAALAWEARHAGCKALVFSPGDKDRKNGMKTKSVHEAVEHLKLVLACRDRKEKRQSLVASCTDSDIPF